MLGPVHWVGSFPKLGYIWLLAKKWSCWGIMVLFKVLCVYCKGGVMWLFPSHLHDRIPTIIAYAHNAWRDQHSTRAFTMTHIQTMNLMRACCDRVFKLTLTYEENILLFSRMLNAPAFVFVRIFPAFLLPSKSHLEPTLSQTDFTFPLRKPETGAPISQMVVITRSFVSPKKSWQDSELAFYFILRVIKSSRVDLYHN